MKPLDVISLRSFIFSFIHWDVLFLRGSDGSDSSGEAPKIIACIFFHTLFFNSMRIIRMLKRASEKCAQFYRNTENLKIERFFSCIRVVAMNMVNVLEWCLYREQFFFFCVILLVKFYIMEMPLEKHVLEKQEQKYIAAHVFFSLFANHFISSIFFTICCDM